MVMSTLKWRMQAITPFSFIDYFLYKVNNDQVPTGDSILQSIQLILSTIRGTLIVHLPHNYSIEIITYEILILTPDTTLILTRQHQK